MSRIEPWHQTNWDWRAAGNFIGGGSGAGLVILAAMASAQGVAYWPLGVLGVILVGVGLLCVWLEIGRPWRAMHVFYHPQTSWMTREAFVSTWLLPATILAVVTAGPFWPVASLAMPAIWVTALLAALYLYCQAQILHASKGIPAWRHPGLIPVIIITGFTEGAGFILITTSLLASLYVWMMVLLVVLLLGRWLAWRRYVADLTDTGAPAKALEVLNNAAVPINFAGHLAPVILIVLGLFVGPLGPWLVVTGALLAVLGGWWMKFVVIARAAFNQGFALPLTPVRGAGNSGTGDKPGWNKGGDGP